MVMFNMAIMSVVHGLWGSKLTDPFSVAELAPSGCELHVCRSLAEVLEKRRTTSRRYTQDFKDLKMT